MKQRTRIRTASPSPQVSRLLTLGLLWTLATPACTGDPPPIPADALDPVAHATATAVSVPQFAATVEQLGPAAGPPASLEPADRAFRDEIERAGLIRVGPDGSLAMTPSGAASAWHVDPGRAKWVVGEARIGRVLAYATVTDFGNLDSEVCCGLTYEARVTTDALGNARPAVVAVEGLSANRWNNRSPPTVARWFDASGRLVVPPTVLTAALTGSLRALADAPPVGGIRQWEDGQTRRCPNAAAIDALRRRSRQMLFAERQRFLPPSDGRDVDPQVLDPDTAARFVAGEFDARFDQDPRLYTLAPAAAPVRSLSEAFAECARSTGVDAHTAAWATLWSHDAALLWGDTSISRPRFPPRDAYLSLQRVRKVAALNGVLDANAAMRMQSVQALAQSGFPDVAAYATWVHSGKRHLTRTFAVAR